VLILEPLKQAIIYKHCPLNEKLSIDQKEPNFFGCEVQSTIYIVQQPEANCLLFCKYKIQIRSPTYTNWVIGIAWS
jgi:hypothetical protein